MRGHSLLSSGSSAQSCDGRQNVSMIYPDLSYFSTLQKLCHVHFHHPPVDILWKEKVNGGRCSHTKLLFNPIEHIILCLN